jgi:hypothetical protein
MMLPLHIKNLIASAGSITDVKLVFDNARRPYESTTEKRYNRAIRQRFTDAQAALLLSPQGSATRTSNSGARRFRSKRKPVPSPFVEAEIPFFFINRWETGSADKNDAAVPRESATQARSCNTNVAVGDKLQRDSPIAAPKRRESYDDNDPIVPYGMAGSQLDEDKGQHDSDDKIVKRDKPSECKGQQKTPMASAA